MGSGGGDDPLDIKGGLDNLVEVASQVVTGGVAKYRDGKWDQGWSGNMVDEGLGEITGRNMARQKTYEDRVKLEEEKIARDKEIADERERQHLQDTEKSQTAASYGKMNALMRSGPVAQSNALADEKDFLGL